MQGHDVQVVGDIFGFYGRWCADVAEERRKHKLRQVDSSVS